MNSKRIGSTSDNTQSNHSPQSDGHQCNFHEERIGCSTGNASFKESNNQGRRVCSVETTDSNTNEDYCRCDEEDLNASEEKSFAAEDNCNMDIGDHSNAEDSHSNDEDGHSNDEDSHSNDEDNHSNDEDSHSNDEDSHSNDEGSYSNEGNPSTEECNCSISKDYADISGEDSDEEDSEQIDPQMFTPIYDNASISVCGAICAIMEFKRSCRLSFSCIAKLLQLLQLLCPASNCLPQSVYAIKKFFRKFSSLSTIRQFCSNCEEELSSVQPKCDKVLCKKFEANSLISFSTINAIKRIMKSKSLNVL